MDFRTFKLCIALLLFTVLSEIAGQQQRQRQRGRDKKGRQDKDKTGVDLDWLQDQAIADEPHIHQDHRGSSSEADCEDHPTSGHHGSYSIRGHHGGQHSRITGHRIQQYSTSERHQRIDVTSSGGRSHQTSSSRFEAASGREQSVIESSPGRPSTFGQDRRWSSGHSGERYPSSHRTRPTQRPHNTHTGGRASERTQISSTSQGSSPSSGRWSTYRRNYTSSRYPTSQSSREAFLDRINVRRNISRLNTTRITSHRNITSTRRITGYETHTSSGGHFTRYNVNVSQSGHYNRYGGSSGSVTYQEGTRTAGGRQRIPLPPLPGRDITYIYRNRTKDDIDREEKEVTDTSDEEEAGFYRPPHPFEKERDHPFTTNGVFPHGSRTHHACEESSCYPATGDLLLGREDKLWASSTCGTKELERFCIVSHLEEKKKCFYCNSRPENRGYKTYHGIENIVRHYRGRETSKTWWQSENGVENVTIQFDLEAEFHFTHLIITFRTFRPAAMLIERSHDFGRTWKVYQYFAYNCAESFPGVPYGPRRLISDVVCESQYSSVEPSKYGEVIFRVLPPNIPIDDPYSPEVQNLLKMTNLRINFTRLHTLGDNLLDSRKEIQEKYYYAIQEMVVRGSCSCYGHASRCIAEPGQTTRPDMVHGRCECTHHTKGLNCEQCEDFYNDSPWRPAIGLETNACKICNCNGHATRCHFDPAVWEATKRQSGGVCDDCQHNTMGHNCEGCKPFFYQDPGRDIRDPNICQPCDCDPRGSLDDGICDSRTDPLAGLVAGHCHCKKNVDGRRCDRCKNGFWNFQAENPDGCLACTCNSLGTIHNQGCNVYTGDCECKRNVVGRDCNQCLPEYYGLSEEEQGCKPCDCDPGGAYDNNCDVITGQCRCRPHVGGRRCDQPEQGFFAGNLDYMVYEAELARGGVDCQVILREPYGDRNSTWTGLGFMRVFQGSHLEFDITDVPTSMEYDIVIRYEPQYPRDWEEAKVILERPGPIDPTGPCANTIPQDDTKIVSLPSSERHAVVFPPACLEKGKNYKVHIEFTRYDRQIDSPSASVLIDSIALIPRVYNIPFFQGTHAGEYMLKEFERFRCGQAYYTVIRPAPPDVCKKYLYSIGFYVYGQGKECSCDLTGSESSMCSSLGGQCRCKPYVVGRRCDRCAPGFYGFGPGGCKPCDCNSIGSLDNFCDAHSGQCKCRPNTYGRQCNECQPGFWNYPTCQRCDCSGHAEMCNSKTGHCIECRDFTAGTRCERCEVGFYGDPRIGVGIPCRPCPCPGVKDSGVSHADTCDLDPRTQNVVCHCHLGYTGDRCDHCADNYFGDPTIPGGECQKCDCNNNIDVTVPGNCDAKTGECLQCLYNTGGRHCESCLSGYYGDASQQQCRQCVCNVLGTNSQAGPCHPETGQCPCFPNVIGLSCDRCAPDHWKIASGKGCEPCDCDPLGSYSTTCNEFDGQCQCKPGHGGRRCDECQANHWGDPNIRCYPCECDLRGASTQQCMRQDGACICQKGIAGRRCDLCARGYTGQAPYCEPCGECFDNWDLIIEDLKEYTLDFRKRVQDIQKSGIEGAYTEEFQEMEEKLQKVRDILGNANVTSKAIDELKEMIDQTRANLTASEAIKDGIEKNLNKTMNDNIDVQLELSALEVQREVLERKLSTIKGKADELKEGDIDGAFNITKEAQRRLRAAEQLVHDTGALIRDSEQKRQETQDLLDTSSGELGKISDETKAAFNELELRIDGLEDRFLRINKLVCHGSGTLNSCDPLCGGAGCNKCGGISCKGAVYLSEDALNISRSVEEELKKKEKEAKELQEELEDARKDAYEALDEAQKAFDKAQMEKNMTEETTEEIHQILQSIDDFLKREKSKPAEIRYLADLCLGLSISRTPEEIENLAKQIAAAIGRLENIDDILRATEKDLKEANELKRRADSAKERADTAWDVAQQVNDALVTAGNAQDAAEDAIRNAEEDIVKAEKNLNEIMRETAEIRGVVDASEADIQGLKKRLEPLKKTYYNNQLNLPKASREAETAGKFADLTKKNADYLEQKYADAKDRLDDVEQVVGGMKDRADRLKERAQKLAEGANSKLNQLQAMEDEFKKNEKKLKDYSDILDELKQEALKHLAIIDQRGLHYKSCV